MNRLELNEALCRYKSEFNEERYFIPRFRSLISNFSNCYSRSLESGHITASSWIINGDGSSALLIHHRKLDRWLQPGGHADGDEDVRSVATKEATEETGLSSLNAWNHLIFDLDIHIIPRYKEVKAHFHFDIRFLFMADEKEEYLNNQESKDISWYRLDEIGKIVENNQSIQRMILKTKSIFK